MAQSIGMDMAMRIRIAAWGSAAALLLVPLVAMRFTPEVRWTGSDFAVAGGMLLAAGAAIELFMRTRGGWAYRVGAVVAVAAAFLLVWVTLAIGIIGSERDDANLLFAGVLAIVVGGTAIARLRPRGMAWAMLAAAVTQAGIGVFALVRGLGAEAPTWPRDVVGVTGLFVTLWLVAAALFGTAARRG